LLTDVDWITNSFWWAESSGDHGFGPSLSGHEDSVGGRECGMLLNIDIMIISVRKRWCEYHGNKKRSGEEKLEKQSPRAV